MKISLIKVAKAVKPSFFVKKEGEVDEITQQREVYAILASQSIAVTGIVKEYKKFQGETRGMPWKVENGIGLMEKTNTFWAEKGLPYNVAPFFKEAKEGNPLIDNTEKLREIRNIIIAVIKLMATSDVVREGLAEGYSHAQKMSQIANRLQVDGNLSFIEREIEEESKQTENGSEEWEMPDPAFWGLTETVGRKMGIDFCAVPFKPETPKKKRKGERTPPPATLENRSAKAVWRIRAGYALELLEEALEKNQFLTEKGNLRGYNYAMDVAECIVRIDDWLNDSPRLGRVAYHRSVGGTVGSNIIGGDPDETVKIWSVIKKGRLQYAGYGNLPELKEGEELRLREITL